MAVATSRHCTARSDIKKKKRKWNFSALYSSFQTYLLLQISCKENIISRSWNVHIPEIVVGGLDRKHPCLKNEEEEEEKCAGMCAGSRHVLDQPTQRHPR